MNEEKALQLDELTFDQDALRGYRYLERNGGCYRSAADLIEKYRAAHPGSFLSDLLKWHEGQARAAAGQYDQAIILLRQTYKSQKDDFDGWNAYVDATVAFLQNDKEALLNANARMLQTPRPADAEYKGVDWPPNRRPVEDLIRCFGRPYADLRSPPCSVKK